MSPQQCGYQAHALIVYCEKPRRQRAFNSVLDCLFLRPKMKSISAFELRTRLRSEGTRRITQFDLRTNEQDDAVARSQDESPPFIAAGPVCWKEIRRACEQTADVLDAAWQANDRKLRTFLDKNEGMNATPEVFTAHHARIILAD